MVPLLVIAALVASASAAQPLLRASAVRRQAGSFVLSATGAALPAACIGGQCTLDQLGYLANMSAATKNTPPECSKPPPFRDNFRPISEVKVGKDVEADCYLNYYPACTTAARARDYVAYALTASILVPYFHGDEEDHGGYRTTKGVSPLEAKLCVEHGWIDLPKDLIFNTTALEEEADRQCQRLDAMFPGFGKSLTWAGFAGTCFQEGDWFPPGRMNTHFVTREEMLKHEIWKCELGRHVLACDMAECIYNFCRLPDGRVATGKNCREDWMDPQFVEKHFWPVFAAK